MALADTVKISGRFLRSSRIDIDSENASLDGYVFPSSLKELLLSMAHQQEASGQGAYIWTGPYGSGKSSLALIISKLLSGGEADRKRARASVGDKEFVDRFLKCLPPKSKGWRTLKMVGELGEPHKIVANHIKNSGWSVDEKLNSDKAVIDCLIKIAKESPRSSGGLILFVDEMGKFLEKAVSDSGDIYFFQLLAEAASRSDGRLIVVGVLHQAFQEYARNLAKDIRDEWMKIQGRYSDLAVNISSDEQIDLISRAIITEKLPKSALAKAKATGALIRKNRPSFGDSAISSLANVWPLNPLTALMLGPLSRKSYGQNQRSVFSFLSSSEALGFQDFLRKTTDTSTSYTPVDLWEYLRFNMQSSIAVSSDSHHFANALEAIDRSIASDEIGEEAEIIKCILLLELTRQQTGLGATEEALALCLPSIPKKVLVSALHNLQEKSLIVFKRYRGTYGISEGSDFDIEAAIDGVARETVDIDLSAISSALAISVVSAKRHYHETGTMRWCEFSIIPAEKLVAQSSGFNRSSKAFGLISLVLPTRGETQKKIEKEITKAQKIATSFDHVIATSPSSDHLILLAKEHSTLNYILANRREVDRDKVARREIRDRIDAITRKIEQEVWRVLDDATWFIAGRLPEKFSWARFNGIISDLADSRFLDAPKIFNELINRSKPSGSANGALKLLIHAMLLSGHKENLGFEKYPAEAGLYYSLLSSNGLHKPVDDKWIFVPPIKGDKANLFVLWSETRKFLKKQSGRSVSLTEIYEIWEQEPFGVSRGLMPLFAVLFLITERSSLAFYREGVFLSDFSDVDADYLLKAPDRIQFRWMDMSDLSRKLLANLADVAGELNSRPVMNLEPLDVARALISAYETSAPWVQKTSRLSKNALKIRTLFKQSHDPNKFIFDAIPALFNDEVDITSEKSVQHITKQIRDGLQEIRNRYPELLGQLRDQLFSELQVPSQSPQAIKELNNRAKNIVGVSGEVRLEAFIGRLEKFDNSIAAIEGLVGMAVDKPTKNWVDNDTDRAAVELMKSAESFNRNEAYARVKGRKGNRESMAVVVGMDGRPVPVIQEFNILEGERVLVNKLATDIQKALSKHGKINQNIALAALATVSAVVIGNENTDGDEDEDCG